MNTEAEKPILDQIHDLVAQEKLLRAAHLGTGLNSAERGQLDRIQRDLDRCWDLLRHRRAADEFGQS
jgi:hypothetical protein